MMNRHRLVMLLAAALVLLVSVAMAAPTISLYKTLDKSPVGPSDQILYGSVATIYVVVENAEMMVGGASFRIQNDYGFIKLGESFPAGLVIGDLFSGVEIGLTTPIAQFGTPAIIGSFLLYADRLTDTTYWVTPHPDNTEVLVADSLGNLFPADGNSLTLRSYIRPQIGIFFDEEGTQLDGSFNGGVGETVTTYLMLRDLQHPIDAVHLSLDLPAGIELVSADLAPGAAMTGDWATGATLVFSPALPAATVAPLAVLTLTTGTEVTADMPLIVAGDDFWGPVPFVTVAPIGAYSAEALTATMSIPVANEDLSWGGVKALFR